MYRRTLASILALCLFLASQAAAQPTIGVFAGTMAREVTANPTPFTVTNNFYVLALDVPDGINGFRFTVDADPAILLFGSSSIGTRSPLAIYGPNDWVVTTASCVNGIGVTPLISYQYGVFATGLSDLPICVTPLAPDTAPVYTNCNTVDQDFALVDGQGVVPNGCFMVYPSAICGPFADVFRYQLDDVGGPAGTNVVMPVSSAVQYGAKCTFTGYYIGEASVRLTWDSAAASFVSVNTFLVNWSANASNITAGSVDLTFTAQNEADFAIATFGATWGTVTFKTGVPGSSTLVTTSNEVVTGFDGVIFDAPFQTATGQGSISVGTVPTETVSFGSMKARY